MLIYPAIDLYKGEAVRLIKGDYACMTVYGSEPEKIAVHFRESGAKQMHIVDLEGAKNGATPNLETVVAIKKAGGLFCEIGGGIRSMETIDTYLSAGLDRVILGTAAVTEEGFVEKAVKEYGEHIAVGVDIKDGFVAIKGWQEKSSLTAMDFCRRLEDIGVSTLICTDISRDGMMKGTNHALYRQLMRTFRMNIIASGGVSSLEDVKKLKEAGLYGAIIGKALYTGTVDLKEAIEVAQ